MPASRIARRLLPRPEVLMRTRGLAWLGRYLDTRPWLWVAHRRSVALGVALGLGIGVIPLPTQMVLAAVLAIALRANVAAAVAATWLTNPFTLVPVWGLAIFLGSLASGQQGQVAMPGMLELSWTAPSTWGPTFWAWLQALGPPLLIGLPLAGLVLGAAAYLLVYGGWWVVIVAERRRRSARSRNSGTR